MHSPTGDRSSNVPTPSDIDPRGCTISRNYSLRLTGRTVRRKQRASLACSSNTCVPARRAPQTDAPPILSAFVDASYLQSPSDHPIEQRNVERRRPARLSKVISRLTGRKRRDTKSLSMLVTIVDQRSPCTSFVSRWRRSSIA